MKKERIPVLWFIIYWQTKQILHKRWRSEEAADAQAAADAGVPADVGAPADAGVREAETQSTVTADLPSRTAV